MTMPTFWKNCALLTLAVVLAACAREDQEAADASPGHSDSAAALPSGDPPLASIDAEGRVAPFGMAARAPKQLAAAETAAPVAETSAGAGIYAVHCVACHGADAQGVQGLGASLRESSLVAESDVAGLVAFLQVGRAADAADNVSGVPMPAFAWMPAGDLQALAEHLKSLQ